MFELLRGLDFPTAIAMAALVPALAVIAGFVSRRNEDNPVAIIITGVVIFAAAGFTILVDFHIATFEILNDDNGAGLWIVLQVVATLASIAIWLSSWIEE